MEERGKPDEYTLKAIAALSIALQDGQVTPVLTGKVEGIIETFVTEVKNSQQVSDNEASEDIT